jgi:hypothetical protein
VARSSQADDAVTDRQRSAARQRTASIHILAVARDLRKRTRRSMAVATLTYKGYTGILEVDLEARELFGRTVGTRDLITFQGRTVEEARKSFEESMDFHLMCCEEE